MLVEDTVDKANFVVDVINGLGFIVDFKNRVLRFGKEEVMLTTMSTSEKSSSRNCPTKLRKDRHGSNLGRD